MSGYTTSRFVDSINPQFICLICNGVVSNPVQCCTCMVVFCKQCHQEFRFKNKKCFSSCSSFEVQPPPQYILEELEMLRLRCKYADCKQLIMLKNIDIHENECDYMTSECPQCNLTVQDKMMQKHLNEACDYKQITCQSCKQMLILKEYKEHKCYLLEQINCKNKEMNLKDQKILQLQTKVHDLNEKVERLKIKLEHKKIKLQIIKQKKQQKRIKPQLEPNHRPRAGSTDIVLNGFKGKQENENQTDNQKGNKQALDIQKYQPYTALDTIQELTIIPTIDILNQQRNLSEFYLLQENSIRDNQIYNNQVSQQKSANRIQDFYDSDQDSVDDVPPEVKYTLQERNQPQIKRNNSTKVDQKKSLEKAQDTNYNIYNQTVSFDPYKTNESVKVFANNKKLEFTEYS